MEFINEAVLHAAGQWWIYPLLLVFFFVDGFAMVVPSETLIVALAAYSRHSREPNLWILGLTALIGAIAGDNMAYLLGSRDRPRTLPLDAQAQGAAGLRLGPVRARKARRRADLHRPLHPLGPRRGQLRRRHHGLPAPPVLPARRLRLPDLGGVLARASACSPARSRGCTTTRCSAPGSPSSSRSCSASAWTTRCAGGTSAWAAATRPPARRHRRPHTTAHRGLRTSPRPPAGTRQATPRGSSAAAPSDPMVGA